MKKIEKQEQEEGKGEISDLSKPIRKRVQH
jgi:hypothetical protein